MSLEHLLEVYLSGHEEAPEQVPECFGELYCPVSVAPSAATLNRSHLDDLKNPQQRYVKCAAYIACFLGRGKYSEDFWA